MLLTAALCGSFAVREESGRVACPESSPVPLSVCRSRSSFPDSSFELRLMGSDPCIFMPHAVPLGRGSRRRLQLGCNTHKPRLRLTFTLALYTRFSTLTVRPQHQAPLFLLLTLGFGCTLNLGLSQSVLVRSFVTIHFPCSTASFRP